MTQWRIMGAVTSSMKLVLFFSVPSSSRRATSDWFDQFHLILIRSFLACPCMFLYVLACPDIGVNEIIPEDHQSQIKNGYHLSHMTKTPVICHKWQGQLSSNPVTYHKWQGQLTSTPVTCHLSPNEACHCSDLSQIKQACLQLPVTYQLLSWRVWEGVKAEIQLLQFTLFRACFLDTNIAIRHISFFLSYFHSF